MKQFRFSPIKDRMQLFKALEHIHRESHKLCRQNLGRLLSVAGNIGVFCHFEDEFEYLVGLRKEMTDIGNHWNHKYFRLHEPIVFVATDGVPQATYTYLYIRKPHIKSPNVGDADFYLPPSEYEKLKQEVLAGTFPKGVRMFERSDLDLVRLFDPDIDVSAFVGSYDLDTVATHPDVT